jgi:hypothetical protein
MFKYIILVLAVLRVSSQYCESFAFQDSYYDINLGSSTDRTLSINPLTTTTTENISITYNLCRNVADVCEVITGDETSNYTVTDYQVKK